MDRANNTETIIKPQNTNFLLDFSEIWRYRELLYIFAWRDIKVRYKQTILGVLWVILQPIITMIIFTIFFGQIAKIPSGNLPYPLFVLIGLVFWTFFSNALSHASNSMVENESIVKKTYFPKMILPISAIITSSLDLAINFVILLLFAFFLGFLPGPMLIIILPLLLILSSFTIAGMGLFLSAFNVKYRDVRYVLPFFIQILMFVTPVIYPLSIVSPTSRYIMALNPMTSVIVSIRSVFRGEGLIDIQLLTISIISSLFILLVGVVYFKRTERFFADIV